LSPSHFSKVFRELMGISFSKFAFRYRLKQAAYQLVRSDDPIKQIALEWGFIDTSHFLNSFL
jgi:AraC-like DNA-binding protein